MNAVLVIGSGQRVRRAALPAILSRPETWNLAGIRSRKPKQIHAEDAAGQSVGGPLEVVALDTLTTADLTAVHLVYVCVSKGAVPKVLAQLAALLTSVRPIERPALLIDTPVLLFKHMFAAKSFDAFPRVFVAEDMSTLPWLDTLRLAQRHVGLTRRLILNQSAFAYHGVALAKTLLGEVTVLSAHRRKTASGHERTMRFAGGKSCTIIEPRDYTIGSARLECDQGTVTIGPDASEGTWHLSAELDAEGMCVGFFAECNGERRFATTLNAADQALLGPLQATGPIKMMDAMKRVGFARLLDDIAANGITESNTNESITSFPSVWGLDDGLDDMWIDYLTEKTGRWRKTPFTSARSGTARGVVGALMKLAARIKK